MTIQEKINQLTIAYRETGNQKFYASLLKWKTRQFKCLLYEQLRKYKNMNFEFDFEGGGADCGSGTKFINEGNVGGVGGQI